MQRPVANVNQRDVVGRVDMVDEVDESVGFPCDENYRWPAEWEPHAGTWIAWPHNRATWPGRFEHIPPAFARLTLALAELETVHVLAARGVVAQQAARWVGRHPRVVLHDVPTNDAWVRDYGPMFLTGAGGIVCVDWRFNSWGGKYPPWDLDDAVTGRICRELDVKRYAPAFILEGGAVDTDGRGTVLTTESCLLDPRRNGSVSRSVVTRYLERYACARQVIWLSGKPLTGDDTDGHVDQVARFVGPQQVVAAVETDENDVNFRPLRQNLEQLRSARDADGQALDIVPLPMPRPVVFQGQRVPASYCNFYIANRCVIVPQFDDPADRRAREILESVFPDRQVTGLPARDIVWGLGAFHCLTQQQPAGLPQDNSAESPPRCSGSNSAQQP